MRLTEKKMDAINEAYTNIRTNKETYVPDTHRLNIREGFHGATIFADNWQICKVEELTEMIAQLTAFKQAIEDETGIC